MSIHSNSSNSNPPSTTTPSPQQRLSLLTSHLQTPQSTPSTSSSITNPTMSNATRPPITCHVLDTTTGRPAANLAVKLSCIDFPGIEFVGTTNSDGRIASWANEQGPNGAEGAYVESKGGVMAALFAIIAEHGVRDGPTGPPGSSLWKLQFNTGAHYGIGNTFFPIVELSFLVVKDEHFHVPLLLGPYSFTTYRGS